MIEDLPADVAGVLEAVLDPADPVHAALRAQAGRMRVGLRCGCGCGTADLEAVEGVAPAEPVPGEAGLRIAVQALLYEGDGGCPGEVLVFVRDGRLAWVEVAWWSDATVTLAEAARMLRARGGK
ncbi:hypothetical protein [Nocardiopsis changdeensis]|uniref:hypothetical protein n=1 Tax=Nocardiopsis changdeensis TaxID=2831969 RepID=UPI003F4874A7